jgi:hypothetical protein
MYFALLKFFKYGNFNALPQLGNNHNLDPKSKYNFIVNGINFYKTIHQVGRKMKNLKLFFMVFLVKLAWSYGEECVVEKDQKKTKF